VKAKEASLGRLGPPSRPNDITGGLKCPSLGRYVRTFTKSFFFDFNEFGLWIQVDE